jgi:F-type H+-transporting ATPase subunit b
MRRLVLAGVLILAFFGASAFVARSASASEPKADAATSSSEHGEKKAGEDTAAAAAKLNPIFPFDFGLSFWTVVVFFIALWVLSKYAWKPISDGLQKREDGIAGQIAEAQKKNDEARSLLAEYEKKLADAAAEVRSLLEQGRRDAEKMGQQIVDKARDEAGIEHQRALQQIESATSSALKELAEKSASLAVDLAGKIVGTQLKPADHSRLIDQAVTAFTQSAPAKVNGKS